MTGTEALQSVQFVTVKAKRVAVLGADQWEELVDWLEALEDTHIAREAYAALERAGGDRRRAGWLEWEEAEKELE